MDPNRVKRNIDEKVLKWHHKTSNDIYKPVVCIVCDQFILPKDRKYLSITELNNHQELLYPDSEYLLSDDIVQSYRVSFPEVEISNELRNSLQIEYCLLSPRSSYNILTNQDDGFDICKKCYQCLSKKQRPKFCIANNFCFGEAPTCLLELTDVERAVITPVKTHGFCFCYTGGQKLKLQGSLSYYKVESSVILKSIAHLKGVEANIVAVVYGNVTQKQYCFNNVQECPN